MLKMPAVRAQRETSLASSPALVWPLITDTDRTNRLLGFAPVTYAPIAEGAKQAARYVAETRFAGLRIAYEEAPFEWVFRERFSVLRRCIAGPFESIAFACALEPTQGAEPGARLRVTVEIQPKYAIFRPIAWLAVREFTRNIMTLGRALDDFVASSAPDPFSRPVTPADHDEAARALTRLRARGVRGGLANQIATYVESCSDADAARIRPYELADEWTEPRREVLSAMLHAAASGLVELRWHVLCPSCRTASDEVPSLDAIGAVGHCQMCDISFELEVDRAIEATFTPHPAVRSVVGGVFCLGGPARTPHVLVQTTVEPFAERELAVPLLAGRYRVFSRGGGRATLTIGEDLDARAEASIEPDRVAPAMLSLRPGGVLSLRNVSDEARHVKIEHLEYASAAATAHDVSSLAEHRDLFGSALIKPKTPLKVARVALLFSDLTGSTALYAKVGDAAAFRLVDDHYDVLREVIAAHEGRVVKTMGDAVMASFASEEACARAAVECIRRFEQFRAGAKHGQYTQLKVGFFAGPCYVIQANDTLDYFGQTVNVASRLQHEAASGEVVMPARAALGLGDDVVVSDVEVVRVKGVDDPVPIVRVRLRG